MSAARRSISSGAVSRNSVRPLGRGLAIDELVVTDLLEPLQGEGRARAVAQQLQYQKQIRPHEARRLLLTEPMDC